MAGFTPMSAPEVIRTTHGEPLINAERYGQFVIAQTTTRKVPRIGTIGGDWLLGTVVEERIVTHVTSDDDSLPIVAVSQVLDYEFSWGSGAKHRAVASALASMAVGKLISSEP